MRLNSIADEIVNLQSQYRICQDEIYNVYIIYVTLYRSIVTGI